MRSAGSWHQHLAMRLWRLGKLATSGAASAIGGRMPLAASLAAWAPSNGVKATSLCIISQRRRPNEYTSQLSSYGAKRRSLLNHSCDTSGAIYRYVPTRRVC